MLSLRNSKKTALPPNSNKFRKGRFSDKKTEKYAVEFAAYFFYEIFLFPPEMLDKNSRGGGYNCYKKINIE